MTYEQICKVVLYTHIDFIPMKMQWNSQSIHEDMKIIGFGLLGAYRSLNQVCKASCKMMVENKTSGEKCAVKCLIEKDDMRVHSFFLKRPIEVKKGEQVLFWPIKEAGEFMKIGGECTEFVGSDGSLFSLGDLDNAIAVVYYF